MGVKTVFADAANWCSCYHFYTRFGLGGSPTLPSLCFCFVFFFICFFSASNVRKNADVSLLGLYLCRYTDKLSHRRYCQLR